MSERFTFALGGSERHETLASTCAKNALLQHVHVDVYYWTTLTHPFATDNAKVSTTLVRRRISIERRAAWCHNGSTSHGHGRGCCHIFTLSTGDIWTLRSTDPPDCQTSRPTTVRKQNNNTIASTWATFLSVQRVLPSKLSTSDPASKIIHHPNRGL